MNQNGWAQHGPEETHQARGQQQAERPAPGKVTRTSRLSSERGPAVQRKPAPAGDMPRPRARASDTGTSDLYMDMAHRGVTALMESELDAPRRAPVQRKQAGVVQLQLATETPEAQPETGPSGHPVPLDVFLRVVTQTRLHRLPDRSQAAGDLQGPDITSGQQTPGPEDLIATPILLGEGTVVRAATPASASTRVAGYRFVCNAAELFGWVPEASVVELDATAEPEEGAEDLDEETPQGDVPELSAADYDNLVILSEDAVVYRRPSEEANPVAVVHRMESVVYIRAPVTVESRRWQQIRMVREPREIGWIQDSGNNTGIESATMGGRPGLSVASPDSPAVREVEQMLANLGYLAEEEVDEHFGPATVTAVHNFQTDHGLKVDGVVGPYTMAALRRGVPEGGLSMPEDNDERANQEPDPLVREVEQMLADLGYPVIVDGILRESTDLAIRQFQAAHGLEVDGNVGPITMAALRDALDPSLMNLPTGTWVAGYTLIHSPTGHAMTPDGQVSSAGFASHQQGGGSRMAAGPCEVLHHDGSPAIMESGGHEYWYVRGVDGGAGWTPATYVRSPQTGTETEAPATETSMREELAQLCPNGITVCFVTQFNNRERAFGTFLSEGAAFAASHHAVAISGGQIVTGTVNLITHKNQIVGILASIQQALRAGASTLPAWARVAHLAFFTHGSDSRGPEWGGIETDADGWEDDGVLHEADLAGFARSLAAFCTGDVEVSLFACSTGLDYGEETNYEAWTRQDDLRGGEGSFADTMSDELVEAGASDAMVMGHTTIGHTVQNPAARLYTGSDAGGVNVFNYVFLPLDTWLGEELGDVAQSSFAPDATTFLADELFMWFFDMIFGDSALSARMSSDPELFRVEMREQARAWVHSQYLEWGVVTDEMLANQRFVLSRYHGDDEPIYKPDAMDTMPHPKPMILAGTEITILGPTEMVTGYKSYPVTWDGDPYGPDSPNPVQAYLPVDWVETVYD